MNGDLRVAYRASHEGERDIVFVSPWFTNCEDFPELPSIQGWFEAMTSLGRLIFFDQPGTGASDPVTPGALPTLELWADSITAVLDDLGSRRSGPRRDRRHVRGSGAVRGHTSVPHNRAGRARGLRGSAGRTHRGIHTRRSSPLPWSPCGARGRLRISRIRTCRGTRKFGQRGHDMERLAASPGTVALMMPLLDRHGRAGVASHSPRPDTRPPSHRRRHDPAQVGQGHRRSHTGREIRRASGAQRVPLRRTVASSRFRRSPSSSPASKPTLPMIGCWPPCCSPTSSTRRGALRRWVTATGMRCLTRTTL